MKTAVNIPARSVVKLYELARNSYKRVAGEYGEEAAKDEAEAVKAIEDNFGIIIDRYKHYENKISEIIRNVNPSQSDSIHSHLVLAQTTYEVDLEEIDSKSEAE